MSTPAPTSASAFWRRGTTIFKFLDTVAAPSMIPTRAELDAGTDMTRRISAIDGWTQTNQTIDTPNMFDTFDSKIPGPDQADDSSFTFYEDAEDASLETTLAKGTEGYVTILRKGDIPANESMDVFHVRVASQSPQYTADNEAAKFMVTFTILERPVQGATVPAAASGG